MKCTARLVFLLIVHCGCEFSQEVEETTTQTADESLSAVQRTAALANKHEVNQDEEGENEIPAVQLELESESERKEKDEYEVQQRSNLTRGWDRSQFRVQFMWVLHTYSVMDTKTCARGNYPCFGCTCHHPWYKWGTWCLENCPSQMPVKPIHYCCRSSTDCQSKYLKVALAAIQVVTNLLPVPSTAIFKGWKTLTLAGLKKAAKRWLVTTLTTLSTQFMNNMGNLMSIYYNGHKTALITEFKRWMLAAASEDIAAEALARQVKSFQGYADLGTQIKKAFTSADPTGIASLKSAMYAEKCKDKHNYAFPNTNIPQSILDWNNR